MSFCPVCGAHHDPKIPCADRAGELLRDAGIKPKPMGKKELQKNIKKANRGLMILIVLVLSLFAVAILLHYLGFLRGDPWSARDDIVSGNWWLNKREYDKAIADYTQAIKSWGLSKENLSIAYYGRGSAWYGKEDFKNAVADFSEAIRLGPRSEAYYARGMSWLYAGGYNKAISDFNEAIRIYPQFAAAYMVRGVTEYIKGEFSSAATDLAKSQQFNADFYTAIWLYLAREHDHVNGKAELAVNSRGLDTKKWPGVVVRVYLGMADPSTITSKVEEADLDSREEQMCEANFFLGEWHFVNNRKELAQKNLAKAQSSCPMHSFEYSAASIDLSRLEHK